MQTESDSWQAVDVLLRDALHEALRSTTSVTKAAERLGIGRSTIYRWMAKWPLPEQERKS